MRFFAVGGKDSMHMSMANTIRKIKSRAISLGFGALKKPLNMALSVFIGQSVGSDYGIPEGEFETSDGRMLPIYSSYRYAVKKGWRYFDGLNLLSQLESRGCLTRQESGYLKQAIGSRTIGVSPEDAASFAQLVSMRYPDLFIPGSLESPEGPVLRPSKQELLQVTSVFRCQHASMLQQLSAAGIVRVPAGASVLEIGFTTGGHSTFAWEQLGFRSFGVDNYYGGLLGESSLHEYCKRMLRSSTDFRVGDMASVTSFPSESMDVVFSQSVLEHILDLKSAFTEMYRLLKPGGAIIHNYSPYFCHDGGHALGIGDSPWAHARMNVQSYLRYIEELRPYEAKTAKKWFASALHQNMPQWKLQRLVAAAGFRIGFWMAKPSEKRWLRDLTPQIVQDCFEATPDIGIEDLVSRSVSFVGIKE
jgi:ubiquinone/menaquinone biosynthesis C-methylase UbiE